MMIQSPIQVQVWFQAKVAHKVRISRFNVPERGNDPSDSGGSNTLSRSVTGVAVSTSGARWSAQRSGSSAAPYSRSCGGETTNSCPFAMSNPHPPTANSGPSAIRHEKPPGCVALATWRITDTLDTAVAHLRFSPSASLCCWACMRLKLEPCSRLRRGPCIAIGPAAVRRSEALEASRPPAAAARVRTTPCDSSAPFVALSVTPSSVVGRLVEAGCILRCTRDEFDVKQLWHACVDASIQLLSPACPAKWTVKC